MDTSLLKITIEWRVLIEIAVGQLYDSRYLSNRLMRIVGIEIIGRNRNESAFRYTTSNLHDSNRELNSIESIHCFPYNMTLMA